MKKNIYILILFLSSIFLTVTYVLADESGNETTDEEVVVTASRTEQVSSQSPGVTEVITKAEIEKSGSATVAQAMADQAIPVASNGGASGVAMVQLDGSSAEQTLVLVNGIAANTGCAGSVDLSYFPAAGIQRIEAVHGPLSSLYGANALGGVVNIITDLTGTPQNQVLLSGGSFNTRNLGFNWQEKKWGIACGANFTDGFRARSQSDGNFLMAQYNFSDGPDQYLKLYLQAINRTTQVPGSISWTLNDAQQTDQSISLNLNGKSDIFQGNWEYKVYGQYLDVQYTESAIPSRHQTWNSGFDCAGLYTAGNHEILTGLTMKHQFSDSSIDHQHDQDNGGLFLQDSWFINDKVSLISGLRYDYCTNFPAPLSPRIHLSYALSPDFTMKCGYGKAFRAPTMNELYWGPARLRHVW
jgi:outer membrane cobalamin receptor